MELFTMICNGYKATISYQLATRLHGYKVTRLQGYKATRLEGNMTIRLNNIYKVARA